MSKCDLLRMLANRARNFPDYPMGYHMPELFAAIGEEPPDSATRATLTITASNGDQIVAHGSAVDMVTLDKIVKAAANQAPAHAPEGYRLVPVEPTPEMLCRGQFVALKTAGRADWCYETYRAMLAAAPVAPATQAESAALAKPSDNFVQKVPDKCDRIIWRGHYYHLREQASPVAVATEGYKLVPVEPTDAMLKLFDGFEFRAPFDPKHCAVRRGLWRALLRAAPNAPDPTHTTKE